jgi:hypothetical protein
MNPEQALTVLKQAIDKGFTAGLYSMQDAAVILQALTTLNSSAAPETNSNQKS